MTHDNQPLGHQRRGGALFITLLCLVDDDWQGHTVPIGIPIAFYGGRQGLVSSARSRVAQGFTITTLL